ncbi:MAG TPA: hypothetical protein VFF06_26215 [Polyangia bacterium]|nr:hypothetical protein [Polyangia bacterium]
MPDQTQKPKTKAQDDPKQATEDAGDPRQAALQKKAQDRKDGDAGAPGAAAASQLIGRNCKDAAQYVKLIQKYPDEKDAILEQLGAKMPDVAKQVASQIGEGDSDADGGDKKDDDKQGFDGKANVDAAGAANVELDYTSGKNSAAGTATVTDGKNYEVGATGTRQLTDSTSVTAGVDRTVADGTATNKATLGADYKSDKLAASGEVDVSKQQGASGVGLDVTGGATATLKDGKLYGSVIGGVGTDDDGLHYHFGGGLTITPTEHTALTAAGVMDNQGGIDLRLQYDVFKDKVSGAGDLDDAKKNAMLSLFVGYKKGDGMMSGSPLDDSMGANPAQQQGSGVYAGVKLSF